MAPAHSLVPVALALEVLPVALALERERSVGTVRRLEAERR